MRFKLAQQFLFFLLLSLSSRTLLVGNNRNLGNDKQIFYNFRRPQDPYYNVTTTDQLLAEK